jgi:hypothetical protein
MKRLLLPLLLASALPAQADRMPLPSDTPAAFRNECGSCHLPFPPALLPAEDWRRTMTQLEHHFGTDASVDARAAKEISSFLERNAGAGDRVQGAGDPPRITQTSRFVRKHREVPKRLWSDKRIKSAANCEACHRGAAEGRYSEHDILIPELRGER